MSEVIEDTAASGLPEELLIEIIKRLPVKHVLRSRCVRKSWYHLLHSPYFVSLHSRYQNSLNKHLLFHCRFPNNFSLRFNDKQCKESYELRFPQDIQKAIEYSGDVVYETCNGLICLCAPSKQEVYLWNPALRVFDVLPNTPVPSDIPFFNHVTMGLAFGYLAKTNDYKVIKYKKYLGITGPEVFVYVYSLRTDSWKTVKKGEFGGFSCGKLSNSVVVSGVAYWVASIYEDKEDNKVIVCFDMENDTIREILLPAPYSKENAKSKVIVENSILGEQLSLFYYDKSTYGLHIWVLENAGEPNETWTKKKSLNFEPMLGPMGLRNNGELVLRGARKFLSYDLEKNEGKDIVDDDSLDVFHWGGEFYPHPHQGINRFVETLVLLDVNRQA